MLAARYEQLSIVGSHLRELVGAEAAERRDLAGVLGDVAVEARRRVLEDLHVFVDALHLSLKPEADAAQHSKLKQNGTDDDEHHLGAGLPSSP